MTDSYKVDRIWSDQFIPAIKRIVGPYMLTTSTLDQDQNQATDMVVLTGRNGNIGCRVRRVGYVEKYGNQFTLRYSRLSGAKTEFEKIMAGWCDMVFYAHEDPAHPGQGRLSRWFLLDMAAFRHHIRAKSRVSCRLNSTWDGTRFICYDIPSFPADPPLVIGSSESTN